MKTIITNIVDLLFNNIPFSKKEETIKYNVEKSLNSIYHQNKQEDEIKNLKNILEQSQDLYEVGKLAGYSQEDIDEIKSSDNIQDKKTVLKLINKYKKLIILESFVVAFLVSIIVNNASYMLHVILYTFVLIGIILFFKKREKRFLEKYKIFDLKLNAEGRVYIQNSYDKYVKKLINMISLCFILGTYIIFINIYSYLTFAYTMTNIYEQLAFSSSLIALFVFLVLKNMKMFTLFSHFFAEEKNKTFYYHIKKLNLFWSFYWVVIASVLLVLRNAVEYTLTLFFIAGVISLILLLVYNLTMRKQYVFKNIVINIKRSLIITLSTVLVITYQFMSMDFWLTQPYINTVSPIQREEDDIEYNEDNGVYTIITDKDDFKILQLTDIHLGGSPFSLSKDLKALKATEKLINTTRPDFVVVTGDLVFPMGVMSFSLNNQAPIMQFSSFMRNIGIPWAFTYGNHDTEAMSVITDEQFDELMQSLSYRNSKNLLYPYIQPDIYGRNNQMIEIRHRDGTLMQALFLLDSNSYVPNGRLNEYDYIHDDQVEWYEKQVLQLSKKEGYTIPSMLFFHIPLQQYKEAFELYEKKSDQVKYYYGEIGETMIDKLCVSKYPSQLFDTALRLKSTKAMFCGHDHYNNLSVEYKGIRLTYGYSIDYLAMPGIEEKTKQRGATLITIDKNGEFEIKPYRLVDLK